jgi:hypothetical protein
MFGDAVSVWMMCVKIKGYLEVITDALIRAHPFLGRQGSSMSEQYRISAPSPTQEREADEMKKQILGGLILTMMMPPVGLCGCHFAFVETPDQIHRKFSSSISIDLTACMSAQIRYKMRILRRIYEHVPYQPINIPYFCHMTLVIDVRVLDQKIRSFS